MVSLSEITVGGLTSFMVYAAWVGISVGGMNQLKNLQKQQSGKTEFSNLVFGAKHTC